MIQPPTMLPSMVQTHLLHALPRLFKATSKLGNSCANISGYRRSRCIMRLWLS